MAGQHFALAIVLLHLPLSGDGRRPEVVGLFLGPSFGVVLWILLGGAGLSPINHICRNANALDEKPKNRTLTFRLFVGAPDDP